MQRHILIRGCAVGLLCLLLGLAGCAGGGDDDDTATGVTQGEEQVRSRGAGDVTGQTETVLEHVFELLFGDGSQTAPNQMATEGRQEPVTRTLACERGSVSFTGTADAADQAFTLAGTITFTDCVGITGNLSLDSAGSVGHSHLTSASDMEIDMELNGTLHTDGCALTFAPLLVNGAASQSGNLLAGTFLSGTVHAACADEHLVCTPVNVESTNREDFATSCEPA
jgi:hypothetical protein